MVARSQFHDLYSVAIMRYALLFSLITTFAAAESVVYYDEPAYSSVSDTS